MTDEHKNEPPLDYTDDLPESAGGVVDRAFWTMTRCCLPAFLDPTSKFSDWVMDIFFIECAYCLLMRGVFTGALVGIATGLIAGLML